MPLKGLSESRSQLEPTPTAASTHISLWASHRLHTHTSLWATQLGHNPANAATPRN